MFLKRNNHRGFTLIELMIVVAVIGILAAIAVPNFIAYRKKATIGQCVETLQTIRGALASYAVDSIGNGYPMTSEIPDWTTFCALCNLHGTTLKENQLEQGFASFTYHGVDQNGALDACDNHMPGNECMDYLIIIELLGIEHEMIGSRIVVSPHGIFRQSY